MCGRGYMTLYGSFSWDPPLPSLYNSFFLSLLPRLNEVQEAKASNISIAAFCMLMSAFTLFPTLHQLGPATTVNHVICSFFMAPPPLNYPNPNVCSIHTLVLLQSLPESDLIAPPSVFVCLFSPP